MLVQVGDISPPWVLLDMFDGAAHCGTRRTHHYPEGKQDSPVVSCLSSVSFSKSTLFSLFYFSFTFLLEVIQFCFV